MSKFAIIHPHLKKITQLKLSSCLHISVLLTSKTDEGVKQEQIRL